MASRLQEEYRIKRRVTWVCASLNLALGIGKLVLGFVGQSQALVADGFHSLSDLASDAAVLVAARFASEGADEKHPYGHARFETVASVLLAALLIAVAAGIVVDAVERLAAPETLLRPGWLALSGAAVSIVANEWMFWYSIAAADKTRSPLMRANAWHHRSDAISSVIVLIGVAGSMAGWPMLDSLGAVAVAVLIGKIGWDIGWNGLHELVDTGVEKEKLAEIKRLVESVDGVEAHHDLRTRHMGHRVLVEVHLLVDSQLTVSEAHNIGDRVRALLLDSDHDISEVLIHIDPEDDTVVKGTLHLPKRAELERDLLALWQALPQVPHIERLNLHYLRGAIDVDVVVPLDSAGSPEAAHALARRMTELAEHHPSVRRVEVFFR